MNSKHSNNAFSYDMSKNYYNFLKKRPSLKGKVWHSTLIPHGGAFEKPHNEERLHVQSNEEIKIEPKASFDTREKSIDLTIKSGSILGNSQSLMTQKLINSNKLSKYLTGFIGKKDYRTSEERELDK